MERVYSYNHGASTGLPECQTILDFAAARHDTGGSSHNQNSKDVQISSHITFINMPISAGKAEQLLTEKSSITAETPASRPNCEAKAMTTGPTL